MTVHERSSVFSERASATPRLLALHYDAALHARRIICSDAQRHVQATNPSTRHHPLIRSGLKASISASICWRWRPHHAPRADRQARRSLAAKRRMPLLTSGPAASGLEVGLDGAYRRARAVRGTAASSAALRPGAERGETACTTGLAEAP